MNWFFPYKKETAAVAVPESVCHYSQVIVAGLALLCRKIAAIYIFSAEQCATHAMFCAISVVLCANIAGGSNVSHVQCTIRAHKVLQQHNLHHPVCKRGAQCIALTHRVFTKYTARVMYIVKARTYMGTSHARCTLSVHCFTILTVSALKGHSARALYTMSARTGAQCTCTVHYKCTLPVFVQ